MDIKMTLGTEKTLLETYTEQRNELYKSFGEDFCSADDEHVILGWIDSRDAEYIDEITSCQQLLVDALAMLCSGDKKSIHNANKAIEKIVREARGIRKERLEDVRRAQEVIDIMDRIIGVCDDTRKNKENNTFTTKHYSN